MDWKPSAVPWDVSCFFSDLSAKMRFTLLCYMMYIYSDEITKEKSSPNSKGGTKSPGPGGQPGTGSMSSLQGLPSLTGEKKTGRKSRK